ncbi:kinase-like protein [Fomitiporia mediterranea MF3/22]|uniref:kinase-like protein n=1 Tax=Fomitiporia mediterranea (strain MF3/22) TaxID=694068 RepID=UPI0004408827|nr:kinase-like protein [Fomitiporia mediterranea MF3/22]EJD06807.1 kinase-like protein [Fomitiporia mediterranea MF3/22]
MQNLTHFLKALDPINFAHGGFAVVHKALLISCQAENQIVAVKFPALHAILSSQDVERAQVRTKILQRWRREIMASQSVSHPNVLRSLGFCDNPILEYPEFKGLVLPFCAHGDSKKYIDCHPDADRMSILIGTAAAMFALHSAEPPVVHGDIKAQNILISDNHQALLADFGLSRICETKGFTTQTINGSCRWMATELVRASAEDRPVRTTTASDIWSFGMTILEVLTGRPPFPELWNNAAVFMKIHAWDDHFERPSDSCISDAVWTLLVACSRKDASARPDARHVGLVLDLIAGDGAGQLDVVTISNVLHGNFDNVPSHPRNAQHPSQPYKCKWLHCSKSFTDIDDLVAHERFEFLERRDHVLSRL